MDYQQLDAVSKLKQARRALGRENWCIGCLQLLGSTKDDGKLLFCCVRDGHEITKVTPQDTSPLCRFRNAGDL